MRFFFLPGPCGKSDEASAMKAKAIWKKAREGKRPFKILKGLSFCRLFRKYGESEDWYMTQVTSGCAKLSMVLGPPAFSWDQSFGG
jgi:hypothetical protein